MKRILLFGGAGLLGLLSFVAVLFMGMLLDRSGTGDTADYALEQRERYN